MSRLSRLTVDGQVSTARALAREALARAWVSPEVRRMARPFTGRAAPRSVAFLCGCFNSGTTILREILGSHPEISSMPREGVVYTQHLSNYETTGWTRLFCDAEEIMRINRRQFATLTPQALFADWQPWIRPDTVLLEKSIANVARMVELQSLFPGAAFIVLERSSYPVIEGIVRRSRRAGSGASDAPTLRDGALQWAMCKGLVEAQVGRLDSVYRLQYEDLLERPALHVARIFELLGLAADVRGADEGLRVGDRYWRLIDGNAKSMQALSEGSRREIDAVLLESVGAMNR